MIGFEPLGKFHAKYMCYFYGEICCSFKALYPRWSLLNELTKLGWQLSQYHIIEGTQHASALFPSSSEFRIVLSRSSILIAKLYTILYRMGIATIRGNWNNLFCRHHLIAIEKRKPAKDLHDFACAQR